MLFTYTCYVTKAGFGMLSKNEIIEAGEKDSRVGKALSLYAVSMTLRPSTAYGLPEPRVSHEHSQIWPKTKNQKRGLNYTYSAFCLVKPTSLSGNSCKLVFYLV